MQYSDDVKVCQHDFKLEHNSVWLMILDSIYNDMYRVAINQALKKGLFGGCHGTKNDFHYGIHNARSE